MPKDKEKIADKINRRAVDEIQLEEITGVYDLLEERLRSAGKSAAETIKSAAETMQTISAAPPAPAGPRKP